MEAAGVLVANVQMYDLVTGPGEMALRLSDQLLWLSDDFCFDLLGSIHFGELI